MRVILIFISLSFGFVSTAQSIKKAFYKAYSINSPELLEDFFTNWHLEIQPIQDSEFLDLNDTVQNAYLVYMEFMNWKNKNSASQKMHLVQNSMNIYFSKKVCFSKEDRDSIVSLNISLDDTLDLATKEKYLQKRNGEFSEVVKELYGWDMEPKALFCKKETNFRPKLSVSEKILFLSKPYYQLLDSFLNENPDENKKLFLEPYIEIHKNLVTQKWEFTPYRSSFVTFDSKMEHARVNYGIGEAVYLKKENGIWTFVSHRLLFYR